MGRKLLVVDDDDAIRRILSSLLRRQGLEVLEADSGRAALERVQADAPEVVVLDLQMPGMDGMTVLEKVRESHPSVQVIVLTASGDVKSAVRATQLGAFDYLTKPFDNGEMVLAVQRALEARALRAEVDELRRQLADGGSLSVVMGQSPRIKEVIAQVRTVAPSSLSVLVLGETGTGKEVIAQAIHRESDRRAHPFVALDCGAIPEPLLESELFGHEKGAFTGAEKKRAGHFHLAEHGTLFLDEVGNLPLQLQAKLLRVLESRQVQSVGSSKATPMDVRFVAATNDDLKARVAKGQFRSDLFFRLAQYTIKLPALRDRPGDIQHLARRFLEEAAIEMRRPVHLITPEALAFLERCRWPGNVRELRNVIRQAVLESDDGTVTRSSVERLVDLETLGGRSAVPAARSVAPAGRSTAPRDRSVAPSRFAGMSLREVADAAAQEAERQFITETLRATRGNKSEAARRLRTDYKTLHVKLKALGLRGQDFDA